MPVRRLYFFARVPLNGSAMGRRNWTAAVLVCLVSLPGFCLGHKLRALRHADTSVLMLSLLTLAVVIVASAIMRQPD
jgi:uncharacterized membrane protein YfcA